MGIGNSVNLDESGDDLIVEYQINGKRFQCFPFDEWRVVNEKSEQVSKELDRDMTQGDNFASVVQSHLREKHGIDASLDKSSRWYKSIVDEANKARNFTSGSPVSTDSTDSDPASETTLPEKSKSSRASKRRSKLTN